MEVGGLEVDGLEVDGLEVDGLEVDGLEVDSDAERMGGSNELPVLVDGENPPSFVTGRSGGMEPELIGGVVVRPANGGTSMACVDVDDGCC